MDEQQEKRRNCAHRIQKRLKDRRAARGRSDLALSVMIQVTGVLAAIINLFPAFPSISATPEPLPEAPTPKPLPEPLPDPALRVYRRGRPSWTQVFRDLESARRHEAKNAIYAAFASRSPEVKPWLDELDRDGDLKALRPYALRAGATDEEIGVAIVAAAKKWQSDKNGPDEDCDCGCGCGGGGKAGSGSKPGGGRKP